VIQNLKETPFSRISAAEKLYLLKDGLTSPPPPYLIFRIYTRTIRERDFILNGHNISGKSVRVLQIW
jgi:hypothetical protein